MSNLVSNLVCCLQIVTLLLLYGILRLGILVASQNTNFSFPDFNSTDPFILLNDYVFTDSSFYLNAWNTLNNVTVTNRTGCGQLLYKDMVKVKDLSLGTVASFRTSFTFEITINASSASSGDGLAFIFATNTSYTHGDSGGTLCLLSRNTQGNASDHLFAVEFDTYLNDYREHTYDKYLQDPSDSHIGVDVNSLNSTAIPADNLCNIPNSTNTTQCRYFLNNPGPFTALIDYNDTMQTLDVWFGNASQPAPVTPIIHLSNFDLSTVLEEYMYVGFSGSTGFSKEIHRILSWNFSSSGIHETSYLPTRTHPSNVALIVGITAAILGATFIILVGFLLHRFKCRKNWSRLYRDQDNPTINNLNMGPRMFTYKELSKATKSYSETELLGSGGFGTVYKGTLQSSGALVAVKCCRKPDSKHAEEGFVAEATSISQIRHRNLVQLQGWCHDKGQMLLVYDYMPNRSLDEWLFLDSHRVEECNNTRPKVLTWNIRNKILTGVAAALAYLHEEWKQCVLHRDIKSSNVLLDADFNAYLGDFGLARLIDHQKAEKTTMMAGTIGYMAPEMYYTGKATKEIDVHSFGVLALEVVCGRRPLDIRAVHPEDHILVDSVWRAHEAGNLLRVADSRLGISILKRDIPRVHKSGNDESNISLDIFASAGDSTSTLQSDSVKDVLQLGLLCCHPNPSARPSMRLVNQMFQTGDFATLPLLPVVKPRVPYMSLSTEVSTTSAALSYSSSGYPQSSLSTSLHSRKSNE